MGTDRFAYGEDDPEDLARDWDTYEAARWARTHEPPTDAADIDWDAVIRMFEERRRARLLYRHSLLDGVCLEGSWGIGPWETVPHNGLYL